MASSDQLSEGKRRFRIGILAIQGAFLEHQVALKKAQSCFRPDISIEVMEIRHLRDIKPDLDGVIIPGGESTTVSMFLQRNGMIEPLRDWIQSKNHVTWGTCAGMILLSKITENQKIGGQSTLSIMDTDVSRNFFGRQMQSFEADISLLDEELKTTAGKNNFHGVFIRAPAIKETYTPEVKVLATLHRDDAENDIIVAAKQGNVFSTAFHPELTDDYTWHLYFLQLIETVKNS
ncbi:hypothetical protein CHS0354_028975 [Potamilus streckersoni]|uniref:glutaminase n=1 Tax=Potamilus streckersoni TaxID=2493646 RepID=A0AAE0W758_9BIVA|nr:hypothetical protein CHS0354_028975 [Potamilus streckersoni]